jgi:hypothetical protein
VLVVVITGPPKKRNRYVTFQTRHSSSPILPVQIQALALGPGCEGSLDCEGGHVVLSGETFDSQMDVPALDDCAQQPQDFSLWAVDSPCPEIWVLNYRFFTKFRFLSKLLSM